MVQIFPLIKITLNNEHLQTLKYINENQTFAVVVI